MYFTAPIESSTLLPKIHRNSMLPPRWSRLPCMNIDVKAVSHVAGCGSAVPGHARLALARDPAALHQPRSGRRGA